MNRDDETLIVHIPSLVATLLHAEREKGAPLTESEVLDIRDNSPAKVLSPEQVAAIEERRGYLDIDPENCWLEWQEARKDLVCEE